MSHDVKIRQAIDWRVGPLGPFKNRGVTHVGKKLKANLERILWGAQLVPWMVGKTSLYENATCEVRMRATPEQRASLNFAKDCQPKIHRVADRMEAWVQADIKRAWAKDEDACASIDFLLGWYAQHKIHTQNKLFLGFDALYQGMLIGAWTAFEVLCEDLAVVSFEKYTTCFGQAEKDNFQLWKTNVRGKKGTTLGFRSRDRIRKSYKELFLKDDSEIRLSLNSDSSNDDCPVDALSLLRNVLVHKSGKIDAEFKKGAKKNDLLMPYRALRIGAPIRLDGGVVLQHIRDTIKTSRRLLLAVDAWIHKHKP